MNNPAGDIELGNDDRNILEAESSEEGAKSKWYKVLEAVLNLNYQHRSKRGRFVPKWDYIFIISSAFAVFIDPLICYIPVIVEDRKCFFWDETLMWSFLGLRVVGDIFYSLDIVFFLWPSRGKGKTKSYGSAWIALGLLLRYFAALPVLETILLLGKYVEVDNTQLFYLIPIQYSVRAYNLYRWLDDHAQIDTSIRRFLKALLDFLPFVLAAHLFGALWYYFAVNEEIICWAKHLCDPAKKACEVEWAFHYNFYCSEFTEGEFIPERVNMTFLKESCAVEVTKDIPTLPFDFGIYLYALQSDLTRTRNLPRKILQCLWWGLRNLSSFGSNLQTSFNVGQNIFSIVISISGLALFLVYLNARAQVSQKISDQLELKKKRETVYQEILRQERNMYLLRLNLLKKVSMLEGLDVKVLKAICRHLKAVTYGDDFYIIREGELVRKMIFITRGSALMYANSHGGTDVCECLERNDHYGEELLNWAFKFASFSQLPVSTRTVLCQTKLEAFAIPSNRLRSIVAEYWWHFKKHLSPSQLEQLAASSLQAAWRRYYARTRAQQAAGTSKQ